jgi:radial spoke head protein 4A
MDFEQAKAFLQKDGGGINLYDHLSEVILKVIKEKPDNAADVFEHLSNMVKHQKFINSNKAIEPVQTVSY